MRRRVCPDCAGAGTIRFEARLAADPGLVVCPECDGAGTVADDWRVERRPSLLLYWLFVAAFVAGIVVGLATGYALAAPRPAEEAAEVSHPSAPAVTRATASPPPTGALHNPLGRRASADTDDGPTPPAPVSAVSVSVAGVASWYCEPGRSRCTRGWPADCLCAAAGPALRVGEWRGRLVTVTAGDRSVTVRLVDWCACPQRLVDLYAAAFRQLAPLSRGLVRVEASW